MSNVLSNSGGEETVFKPGRVLKLELRVHQRTKLNKGSLVSATTFEPSDNPVPALP